MLKRLALVATLCVQPLAAQNLVDLDLRTWKVSVDDARYASATKSATHITFKSRPRPGWSDGWMKCEREFTATPGHHLLWVQGHGYFRSENDPVRLDWKVYAVTGGSRRLVGQGGWTTDRSQASRDLVSQRLVELPHQGPYVISISTIAYQLASIDAAFTGAMLTKAVRPALYAVTTEMGIYSHFDTDFAIQGRFSTGSRFFAVFASAQRRSTPLRLAGVVGDRLWLRDPIVPIVVTSSHRFFLAGHVPLPSAFWQVAEFRIGDRQVDVALGSRNYVTTDSMRK